MLSIRIFTAIAAASVVLMAPTAAALAAGPARPTAACPAWDGVQPPDKAFAILSGVTVLPDCEAWAVGKTNTPSRMLIEKFSGSTWTRQAIPVLDLKNELSSVTATSSDNAWAVGSVSFSSHETGELIVGWNGTSWTQVTPSPALPPGASASYLAGVAASSASNAWAVGSYQIGGQAHQMLMVNWNGTSWEEVTSPNPGGFTHSSRLTSVTVLSANDAWAAGYYRSAKFAGTHTLIMHWNGTTWSQVPSPTPSTAHQGVLLGISATSPTSAWAVGYTIKPHSQVPGTTLILHWNGSTWRRQASPNPSGRPSQFAFYRLYSVSATSASNAWAAGYQQHGTGDVTTLILHWNGRAWRWTSGPATTDNEQQSFGVAAAPNGDAWVVGLFSSDPHPLAGAYALRWNGKNWQL